MKSIRIERERYLSISESYNWTNITDKRGKVLFPTSNTFNIAMMNTIFDQFESIYILDNDTIWGVYSNAQMILVANAPDLFSTIERTEAISKAS